MNEQSKVSRRQVLAAAGAVALTGVTAGADQKAASHGRVKQSIVYWCFRSAGEKWDVETTCRVAVELGCPSVELVDPAEWGTLKKHGLTCAIAINGITTTPPF